MFRALWNEFEAGETDDAQFARSLDRLQPVILNSLTDGGTWKKYNVGLKQLRSKTSVMQKGSLTLWSVANKIYEFAQTKQWLKV